MQRSISVGEALWSPMFDGAGARPTLEILSHAAASAPCLYADFPGVLPRSLLPGRRPMLIDNSFRTAV